LDIRAIIKKEAPYETAIIGELAYAQVIMEGAQDRGMQIEAYNETELPRVSLSVFLYNIERLNAHPTLGGLIESLNVLATRINKERFDYNQAVRAYNARLLTFPTNFTSLLFNIEPLSLFRLRGE
jgi:LemA protein